MVKFHFPNTKVIDHNYLTITNDTMKNVSIVPTNNYTKNVDCSYIDYSL